MGILAKLRKPFGKHSSRTRRGGRPAPDRSNQTRSETTPADVDDKPRDRNFVYGPFGSADPHPTDHSTQDRQTPVVLLDRRRPARRVTFSAADVEICDLVPTPVPSKQVIQRLYGNRIEALCCTSPHLVNNLPYHPLLAATHIAFCRHLPLVLTPDAIWATLVKGLAIHINQNHQHLRSKLVPFTGKVEIRISRDDLVRGDPNLPWWEIIGAFSDAIVQKAPLAAELFNADFSTSGMVERTAFRVALMDGAQAYFKYSLSTLCGVPKICLEGEPEDWEKIREKTSSFSDLGLDWWCDALDPILSEFVNASGGNERTTFWENIYKYKSPQQSGNSYTTGWIRDFFPYLCSDDYVSVDPMGDEARPSGGYCRNAFLGKHTADGPTINQFPGSAAIAPVKWEYLGQCIPLEMVSGLIGVSVDNSLEVRPEFAWIVREESPENPDARNELDGAF